MRSKGWTLWGSKGRRGRRLRVASLRMYHSLRRVKEHWRSLLVSLLSVRHSGQTRQPYSNQVTRSVLTSRGFDETSNERHKTGKVSALIEKILEGVWELTWCSRLYRESEERGTRAGNTSPHQNLISHFFAFIHSFALSSSTSITAHNSPSSPLRKSPILPFAASPPYFFSSLNFFKSSNLCSLSDGSLILCVRSSQGSSIRTIWSLRRYTNQRTRFQPTSLFTRFTKILWDDRVSSEWFIASDGIDRQNGESLPQKSAERGFTQAGVFLVSRGIGGYRMNLSIQIHKLKNSTNKWGGKRSVPSSWVTLRTSFHRGWGKSSDSSFNTITSRVSSRRQEVSKKTWSSVWDRLFWLPKENSIRMAQGWGGGDWTGLETCWFRMITIVNSRIGSCPSWTRW